MTVNPPFCPRLKNLTINLSLCISIFSTNALLIKFKLGRYIAQSFRSRTFHFQTALAVAMLTLFSFNLGEKHLNGKWSVFM